MKNVVKKLNWVLPDVTSKIWTKSIRPMVCALNNCFCRQKPEMNFTQSNLKNMDKQQSAYGVLSKFLKDYMLLPLPYTYLSFACCCHEIGLIPVLFYLQFGDLRSKIG